MGVGSWELGVRMVLQRGAFNFFRVPGSGFRSANSSETVLSVLTVLVSIISIFSIDQYYQY